LFTKFPEDAASAVNLYNRVLSELLEKHAPAKQRVVVVRPNTPWYNPEIRAAKVERRKCERKYRLSKLSIDLENYQCQRNKVNELIEKSKQTYFVDKINEASGPKELQRVFDQLLHTNSKTSVLPSSCHSVELADKFSSHFCDKIVNIRSSINHHDLFVEMQFKEIFCMS
jgi:hypothetical protein